MSKVSAESRFAAIESNQAATNEALQGILSLLQSGKAISDSPPVKSQAELDAEELAAYRAAENPNARYANAKRPAPRQVRERSEVTYPRHKTSFVRDGKRIDCNIMDWGFNHGLPGFGANKLRALYSDEAITMARNIIAIDDTVNG